MSVLDEALKREWHRLTEELGEQATRIAQLEAEIQRLTEGKPPMPSEGKPPMPVKQYSEMTDAELTNELSKWETRSQRAFDPISTALASDKISAIQEETKRRKEAEASYLRTEVERLTQEVEKLRAQLASN